jgi:DNA-binding PadR family transcriptional regulator
MPPTSRPDPRDQLPLKPVDFLILLTLAAGDCHGYALLREIAERSEGAVRLEAGNLYRSIRRLLDEGLLVESGRRPAPDLDDDRRRYYALTPFGRRVVAGEAVRLRALVRFAEAQRIIRPEPT